MQELLIKPSFEVEKEGREKLIGVISDTHVPTRAREIPGVVLKIFEKVDLIIHAGDWVNLEVFEKLEKIAPLLGVHGNMDFQEIKEALPSINSKLIQGKKVGVVHDAGIFGTEKMERIARENGFDILIFGHTHRRFLREKDNVLYLNPGSPTNPIPNIFKPSIALLRIGKSVKVNFLEI